MIRWTWRRLGDVPRWILVLIGIGTAALTIIVWLTFPPSLLPKQNEHYDHEQSEYSRSYCASHPAAGFCARVLNPAVNPANDTDRQEREQKQRIDFFILIGTWLLGYGTVGLAIYTRSLVLDARSEAVKNKVHADEVLKEAQRANRISIDTRAIQLRAYVHFVDMPGRARALRDRAVITYSLTVRNAGQTPARACYTHISDGIFLNGVPADFAFPDVYDLDNSGYSEFDIAPGTERKLDFEIGHEKISAIVHDGGVGLIWGWIEYSDIFPDTPRRRTECCYRITVQERDDGQIDVGTRSHSTHNGYDSDCVKPALTRPKEPPPYFT